MANRTTIVDNNTWNKTHIAKVGMTFASREEEAHDIAPIGLFGQWLENRRESQRLRKLEQERDDERRVDEILSRLHEHGM